MNQFNSFLDQSDHEHLYHTPAHPAHPDLVDPERSGQKKIFSLGTPGAVGDTVTYQFYQNNNNNRVCSCVKCKTHNRQSRSRSLDQHTAGISQCPVLG